MQKPTTEGYCPSDTGGSTFDKGFYLRRLEAVGSIKEMGGACHTGMMVGPGGETIEIYLGTRAGRIIGASFLTNGNHFSVLCGYMASTMAMGRTADEAIEIEAASILPFLDEVPEEKVHLAHLAVEALHLAVNGWIYSEKRQREPREVENETGHSKRKTGRKRGVRLRILL
ncbi:MAG: iron-sulfur cluster assembly scaffold protein [Syntrophobacteraceae bacterium]